ncbi:apolipoprotein N-acyltransferase [Pelagovum pacificum]|uniref:Apolipoprotein N-acyltransferase n=1 Tax=Pelagovum pacificum TaxID=2588711 RepID=A0A5C5GI07_9RHOB|nr:apolipoprotein N-acyltransferase [Pelagovum pacificum]QQA43314.1 apolipoprotein N-acyltransferase [Pelagovum pacificum]TNY33549.1 apolipoprotein N-acyltransferase [Pelagovum pacificum]
MNDAPRSVGRLRYRWWLALLGGAAASLGQAPFGLWPVSLVALAFIIHLAQSRPTRRSMAAALWWVGTGYFLASLNWLVEPFMVDAARDGWMAPFAVVFMAGGLALFWGAAGAAAFRLGPFGLAATLSLAELTRSLILTGFPWALIGHIWIGTPVAQLAALGGPHLLTILALLVAALPVALRRPLPGFAAGVALTVLLIGAGWLRTTLVPIPETPANAPIVRLVQPNAPQDEKWDPMKSGTFFERQLTYTEAEPRPDLVVWPETAVPYFLETAPGAIEVMADAAAGIPVVFGIQRYEHPRYFNALALLNAEGEVGQVYDKAHLVPFGEYVPFADLLAKVGIHGLAANEGGGFSSGVAGSQVVLPGIGPALPLICYEGIFAEEVNATETRPRVLLLITNDAWFGKFSGPYQHVAQARLRAIEMGLPMIRVANTGVSAMIDPHGNLIESLPLGEAGFLDVPLPEALPATPFDRFADWLAIGVILATLALGLHHARRNRVDAESPEP